MLHPQIEPLVDAVRSQPVSDPRDIGFEAVRSNHALVTSLTEAPVPEMAHVKELDLEHEGHAVHARLYEPLNREGDAVAVYFHGGGFVMGTLDSYDALARRLAEAFAMPLVSVDYRLAPEHPFPAGLDDCLAAVRAVAQSALAGRGPSSPIVIVGDSAGGGLASVVAQQLAGAEYLAAQVLLYPTLGPSLLTDSSHRFGTGFFLEMDHLNYYYECYLQGADPTDPRITPLLADNLQGVASAVILVAECDPLRDEAVNYAGLLEHFGVDVELLEAEGMVHSFLKLGGLAPDVFADFDDLGRHVRAFVENHR